MVGGTVDPTQAGFYPWYIELPVVLFLLFLAFLIFKKYVWAKCLFLFLPLRRMDGQVMSKSVDNSDDLKKIQYFIDFQLDEGGTVDLKATQRQYVSLQPKMRGEIRCKGSRLLSFRRGFYS